MNCLHIRLRWLALPALLLLLLFGTLPGCARSDAPVSVELPSTPVVSARPAWAVVRGVYVRILSEPAAGSSIEGHVRRGAVLRVHSRTPFTDVADGVRDHWYSVSTPEFSGWVFGAVLETFPSEALARSAAEAMRSQ